MIRIQSNVLLGLLTNLFHQWLSLILYGPCLPHCQRRQGFIVHLLFVHGDVMEAVDFGLSVVKDSDGESYRYREYGIFIRYWVTSTLNQSIFI